MDWKAVIGTVAPWIATALSGPLGGAAVTAAADALGLSDKTESALKQALSGVTPEQMLALKNADQAFQIRIEELGISREQLSFQDRDSARKRESTVGDKTNRNLAYTIIAAFIAMAIGTLNRFFHTTSVAPAEALRRVDYWRSLFHLRNKKRPQIGAFVLSAWQAVGIALRGHCIYRVHAIVPALCPAFR
jgi:hypothetical protein